MHHVLHIINGEHYAGAERVQDILASQLPHLGYKVTFACLVEGAFAAERQSQTTPLHNTWMRSKLDLRPVLHLARLVKQNHVDLIHSHTPRSVLIGSCLSVITGLPLIHHLHSPSARDSTNVISNHVNARLEYLAIRRAKAVIAVSESLQRYAVDLGIPARRVALAKNGVPTPGPLPTRSRPHGSWSLGMIAMFRPRKGVEVLLQALKILLARGDCLRLIAVGPFEDDAYERHVRAMAEREGLSAAIEWLGYRTDIAKQLSRMDLLVIPSLFGEGMPMVLLEAMAVGVPVVASTVEGIPEVVRHPLDGVLVPPGDPALLADGISQYMHDRVDWGRIRASAYDRQAEHFSDASMARSVASAYASVLNQVSRGS